VPDRSFEIFIDDSPADDDVYGALQELEIEESVSGPSTFRLRLAMNKDASGVWPLTGDDRFALFTKLAATLTISTSDSSSPVGAVTGAFSGDGLGGGGEGGGPGAAAVFEGYVTEVDAHFGAQAQDIYFEVRALDAGVLLTLEEKTVSWPNQADSDIVQQIVSSYGFNVRVEDTSPVHTKTKPRSCSGARTPSSYGPWPGATAMSSTSAKTRIPAWSAAISGRRSWTDHRSRTWRSSSETTATCGISTSR